MQLRWAYSRMASEYNRRVLTIAAGALAGTSTSATNRLLSTVVGAVIGLLATVLIPVPRPDSN